MASKLHISRDLSLPPDFVTSTGVIYGGKGMGKTNLARVLIEELTKARLRWALLDPMGVSWGLRHSKDGNGPGITCVILGGVHGDIPILPTGGAVVADLVVDEGANTIIDFSRHASGKMWTKGERIRFVTDYTTRLFERQGETIGGRRREPIMQILDEAARFIPQLIPAGSPMLAECVGAWEQVCEEGRNIGLGVTFITQRSARMNKSVSELADVMFAFRTVGPNSLSAVMDWLGEHVEKTRIKDLAGSVRELEIGQALVVSPGWLRTEKIVKIRESETFDSSATPKAGEKRRRVTGRAAKPDLSKYEAKMVETIEAAKANDPKALREKIVRLERQLSTTHADQTKMEPIIRKEVDRQLTFYRKEVQRVATSVAAELGKVASLLEGASSRVRSSADDLTKFAGAAVSVYADAKGGSGKTPTRPDKTVHVVQRPAEIGRERQKAPARASVPAQGDGDASGKLGGTPQKILNALLFLETIGTSPASRGAVGGLCGVASDTGTFRTYLSQLRTAGLIADRGMDIALTNEGRARASRDGLPESQAELHDAWIAKFGSTPAKMLRMIIAAYPDAISRETIGNALNIAPDTGTFRTYLSQLRSPGLITDADGMDVRAADTLFPRGLR